MGRPGDPPALNEVPEVVEADLAVQEDFARLMNLIQESYDKGRGRTLDAGQIKVLLEGFHKIAMDAIQGTEIITFLTEKIEELENKKGKLWRPGK